MIAYMDSIEPLDQTKPIASEKVHVYTGMYSKTVYKHGIA